MSHHSLGLEFLDAVVHLARHKGQWHDTRDVHFRAEDLDVETELLTHALDVLETLLVVGTRAADPDLDVVLVEERRDFAKSADDALECTGDLWK